MGRALLFAASATPLVFRTPIFQISALLNTSLKPKKSKKKADSEKKFDEKADIEKKADEKIDGTKKKEQTLKEKKLQDDSDEKISQEFDRIKVAEEK